MMLAALLYSSTIYCAAQKMPSDTIYLKDGEESLYRKNNADWITQRKIADSIAFKKQWLIDSVRLVNHRSDSITYTQRGKLFGNSFADQLGVSESQRDSLIQADLIIEKVKMNAKYIADKAVQVAELQQAERHRDISYKEILTDEQYKKYLQIKRQVINAAYVQESKAKRTKN